MKLILTLSYNKYNNIVIDILHLYHALEHFITRSLIVTRVYF
jgi:hypothetical protein